MGFEGNKEIKIHHLRQSFRGTIVLSGQVTCNIEKRGRNFLRKEEMWAFAGLRVRALEPRVDGFGKAERNRLDCRARKYRASHGW